MRNSYVSVGILALATACSPTRGSGHITGNSTDLGTSQGPPASSDFGGTDFASYTPPGDLSCGGQEFQVQRVQPNVFLVIDRSESMTEPISQSSNTTKWSDLQNAVSGLVTTFDSQIRLGLSLFAGDDDCEAGQIDSALAPNNGAAVLAKIMASYPDSNTPTAATMANVQKSAGLTDPTRTNVVVLATDGQPSCLKNQQTEINQVTATITALAAQTPPVKTYVIGIGDDTASSPGALNAWATAGGTAQSGTTKYFQTGSTAALNAAFQTIAGGVASCTFALSSTPPNANELYVWQGTTMVPSNTTNGYTYTASPPSITLNGTACTSFEMDTTTQLRVIYGCASPPIN